MADRTPLRIEFDDAQHPRPSARRLPIVLPRRDNGTSVQFADAGAEGVDYMVLEPEDYADNNAPS